MLNKLKRLVKEQKLSTLIIILLLSFILMFLVFFGIFIELYNASTENSNLSYNRSISATYSEKLNNAFLTLKSNAQVLCTNQEFVAFADNLDVSRTPTKSLQQSVNQFLVSNLEVYDIILSDGEHIKTFYMSQNDINALPILKQDDSNVKTAYINNNACFLIPIDLQRNGENVGVCYLVAYQSMISDIFTESMRIGSTKCFVLSSSMQILASPDDTDSELFSSLFRFVFDKTSGNEFTSKIGSEEYFVCRNELILDGLYFYSFTPCRAKIGGMLSNYRAFIIIFCIAIVAFALVLYAFLHTFNSSVYKLQSFISDKKTSDETEVPVLFSRELSVLAEDIDEMTNSIKTLQDENIKVKMSQNESRLKAMQSQLNPHFLFNALNCIIGMARVYAIKDIEKVGISMAEIMRYSLSDDLLTSLKDELKIINCYLSIQRTRFPDRFTTEIDIDETLLDRKIIRFSLEPLVENAVKYGIEPLEEGGKVKITGGCDGDYMVFNISDNGKGFSPEIYSELKLRLGGDTDSKLNSHGCGIGILNIHNRLNLYYGQDCGVDVISSPDCGTTVTVKIPLEPPVRISPPTILN